VNRLRNPAPWIAGIALGLAVIHVVLTLHDTVADGKDLGLTLVCWFAVASLLMEKRRGLTLESGPFDTLVGLLFIALVALKSLSNPETTFLELVPAISGIGLALLASGFAGFSQYRRELAVLLVLALPVFVNVFLVDLLGFDTSAPTASVAGFFLRLAGYSPAVQGFHIGLGGGGVNVIRGCSGLNGMSYLFGLALLFLILFPPSSRFGSWLTPCVAVAISFLVNSGRVALLAVLSSQSQQPAFDYWHVGRGSLIFACVSTLLFGLFCLWLTLAGYRRSRTPVATRP
jgi:cyanoexosortase A